MHYYVMNMSPIKNTLLTVFIIPDKLDNIHPIHTPNHPKTVVKFITIIGY